MIRASLSVLVSLLVIQAVAGLRANSGEILVRKRREWIFPPRILMENVTYTESIVRIQSRLDTGDNIFYSLEGRGANREPYNVFIIDRVTGNVRVNGILDREYIALYNLSVIATYRNGTQAEKIFTLRIKVEDQNDNPPVFAKMPPGYVNELSPKDTSVMKVVATDADEPWNINSDIAYTIIDQSPSDDMFYMKKDGTIYVKKPLLDRENKTQYILTVRGQDFNGYPGGNSATATVTINILGANDTLPTLEKEEYEGSTKEKEKGVEVMSIKDKDPKRNNDWRAEPYFRSRYWCFGGRRKPNLDELIKSTEVKNQPEEPRFNPSIKTIPVSERPNSINIKDVIARYPATDGDTGKTAENVRYAKGSDPDNWITIDPKTAEIRLNKMPDRESPALKNGVYYAKILCITEDMPAKTATGTVAIRVEDFNDHCPVLTSNVQTMCDTDRSVIVNAYDEDAHPHGTPFHFSIVPEGTEGKWRVQHLNYTAALLLMEEPIFPGVYTVEFKVTGMQDKACPEPQKVMVQVCACETEGVCRVIGASSKQVGLGPAGIGLLLLGLLLLLFIALLVLLCQRGRGFPKLFAEKVSDIKSHLINYNTKRQGNNTMVPLLNVPVYMGAAQTSAVAPVPRFDFQQPVNNGMNGMKESSIDGFSSGHKDQKEVEKFTV